MLTPPGFCFVAQLDDPPQGAENHGSSCMNEGDTPACSNDHIPRRGGDFAAMTNTLLVYRLI